MARRYVIQATRFSGITSVNNTHYPKERAGETQVARPSAIIDGTSPAFAEPILSSRVKPHTVKDIMLKN